MKLQGDRDHPHLKANCFSKLFYCWLGDILNKGNTRKLDQNDIYEVLPEDATAFVCSKLENHWKAECKNSSSKAKPSLLKAIFRTFGPRVLLWSTVFIIEEAVKIVCPFMIGGLIRHFVKGSEEEFVPYMYALGVSICAIIPTLIHHPFFLALFKTGMKMRIGCCGLVYKKLMKLSMSSLDKTTVGQVINLMSNDVFRFDLAAGLFLYLFVGPLEVLVVSIILWFYIGWAGVSGMIVLLLIIPLTLATAKIFSKLRAQITLLSDKRISQTNEAVNGIQLVKMSCWEAYLEKLIMATRITEVRKLLKAGYVRGVSLSMSFHTGKLIIFFTFLTYVLLGNAMSAEVVFVTMSLYNHVRLSMTMCFLLAMQFGAEAVVIIRKLRDFLLMEEKQEHLYNADGSTDDHNNHLSAKNLCINWNHEREPLVFDLSFDMKEKDLLIVVGAVGSGKTSLLLSILKEVPLSGGTVNIGGRVAYVPQSAWIINASVKDNIILGSKFDAHFYGRVIKYAALDKDLDQMPNRDETVVGDRGATLSGGQKARIGLARALYRNAGVYLLDDPLSAVDASVSQFLFHKCINGFLSKKLRILVTHQLQYLPYATKVLLLDKDQKHVLGSFQELVEKGIDFVKIFSEAEGDDRTRQFSTASFIPTVSKSLSMSTSHLKEESSEQLLEKLLSKSLMDVTFVKTSNTSLSLFDTSALTGSIFFDQSEAQLQQDDGKNAAEELTGEATTASLMLFGTYFRAGGGIFACICCILLNILAQSSFIITDMWLAYWCREVEMYGATSSSFPSVEFANISNDSGVVQLLGNHTVANEEFPHTMWYLGIFAILSLLVVIFGIIRAIHFFHMSMTSGHNLHKSMLHSVIRSPMTFFTDRPTGQILNRFSKDLGHIDEHLPLQMFDLMQNFLLVVGVFVVISIANPWLLLAIAPALICFWFIRNYLMRTFKDVKRIETITKSPIFSHVSATFQGIHSIHCHQEETFFIKQFNELQDDNTAAFSLFLFLGRWLAVRLEWLCTILVAVVAFACLIAKEFTSGSSIGLSLTYVLSLLWLFQWVVRQSTEVQALMTSVERIMEYSKLPTEDTSSSASPSDWPTKGKISFQEVTLKYKSDAQNALNRITFNIDAGERIGVVGRTGAGKSSLINVLFRLFNHEGAVLIDDIDAGSVDLLHLRRNLSIIPQDPTLLDGTLRSSLDPLSRSSDGQLWNALEKVEMDKMVKEIDEGLDFVVKRGGTNMSLGQRQLLCMARALLENNKILIIDEATANVDILTDELIQKKLREEFGECTVLTIAHRLNTIIDYDRIMVLEFGIIKQFGVPRVLLQDTEGAFYNLAKQTGEAEFKNLSETANAAFQKTSAKDH